MKKELQIKSAVGFCKRCFRSRRNGSAYCGECQDEPERMKIYTDAGFNFPRVSDIISTFKLSIKDLDSVIFTYGDTIYCNGELSVGLTAHELTHCFQQMKMGKDKWWDKYLKDKKFRLKQEVEAYQQQYRVMRNIDEAKADMDLLRCAKDLSSKLYGNIVSYDKAVEMIMKITQTI